MMVSQLTFFTFAPQNDSYAYSRCVKLDISNGVSQPSHTASPSYGILIAAAHLVSPRHLDNVQQGFDVFPFASETTFRLSYISVWIDKVHPVYH
jgi:hypothetical protein